MDKLLEGRRARRRADRTDEATDKPAVAVHDLRNALNALTFRLHMLDRTVQHPDSRTQIEAAMRLLQKCIFLVGRLQPPGTA